MLIQDQLTHIIYNKLSNLELKSLPFGLKNGKIGLALFLALYSEYFHNLHARNLTEKILELLINDKKISSDTLLDGKLGLAWALLYLNRKEIIDNRSITSTGIVNNIYKEFNMRYFASPIPVINDKLFSVGIFLQMKLSSEDSLENFYVHEKLINLVDECERLLTQSIDYVYTPEELSLPMLHSLQYFLQECIHKKISTYKALSLLPEIEKRYAQLIDIPIHHKVIFYFLHNEEEVPHIPLMNPIESVKFIGEIGFFSLLYVKPQLFHNTLHNIVSQHPNFIQAASCLINNQELPLTTLLGWGYGILLNEKPDNCREQTLIPQTNLKITSVKETIITKQATPKEAEKKNELIDMSFLTFCIPVRIDSTYRLQNLTSILSFYSRHIRTNYLILEADNKRHIKSLPPIEGLHYMFVSDTNPIFHRTHYINQMLRTATTPFAAIWDTDAISPINQLQQAYDYLLKHESVMVYPYDGCFWQINYAYTKLFHEKKQIEIFQSNYMPRIYMAGYHSVGGAFLVNIEAYWACGGENEHFAGWGPEDVERYHRLEILGKRPIRIAGPLYHLYHTRGINSGDFEQNLAMGTKREYIRICAMMPNELRSYIQTWAWINETKHK